MSKARIVFLDRDGTILKDKHYMRDPGDIEFLDGAVEALTALQRRYDLVVVTNQSGIGRGHLQSREYEIFNKCFLKILGKLGVNIKAVLHCPHRPEDDCRCRKPKQGLVKGWLSKESVKLDLDNSYVIGDKMSDVELGYHLGIKSLLLAKSKRGGTDGCRVVGNLLEAAESLI